MSFTFPKDINDYPDCIVDIDKGGALSYASAQDIVFEGREGCTFNLLFVSKKHAEELAEKYPNTSWNKPIQFAFSEDRKKILCANTKANYKVVSVVVIPLLEKEESDGRGN